MTATTTRNPRALALALVLMFPASMPPPGGEKAPGTAVIVHPGSEIRNIDSKSLRKLFQGHLETNQDILPKGEAGSLYRLNLIIAREAEEAFLSHFLGTTPRQFWRNWAARLLSGENTASPRRIQEGTEVIELVSRDKTALAVILASEVTSDVRILPVDGETP